MAFLRDLARRVGRRPFAWFLLFWAVATVLWLASGAIHMQRQRWPETPPVVAAVPYSDFMPGGRYYMERWPLPLAADTLPAHDPALRGPNRFHYTHLPDGDRARLACLFTTSEGAYGWPRQWVRWSRFVVYDVTDPRRFVPLADDQRSDRNTWEPSQLTRVAFADDGASYRVSVWQWSRMLIWAIGVQAVAAALVVALWLWDLAGFRRRMRLGLCLDCGYDRRGSGADETCPECGTVPAPRTSRVSRRRWWRRPTPVFLASWGALVIAWLIISAASARRSQYHPAGDWFTQQSRGRSHIAVSEQRYGWPVVILESKRIQSFVPGSDGRPEPAAHGLSGGTWQNDGKLGRTADTGDPTVAASSTLYWTHALASVAGLQLIALVVVAATVLAALLARKPKADRYS